jgi:hypothetical protein
MDFALYLHAVFAEILGFLDRWMGMRRDGAGECKLEPKKKDNSTERPEHFWAPILGDK